MAKGRHQRGSAAEAPQRRSGGEPRRRRPALLIAAVAVVGAVVLYSVLSMWAERRSTASPVTERPNVVLVSIDTLRPDHLRCYGYPRSTSPSLDRLAAEGVLFENHVSSTSWTLPAHAALFTSLVDSVHGCTDTDRRLPEGLVTLAEVFALAGYETAGFFSGPYLHPSFGLAQGFTHYENCTSYAQALDDRAVEEWSVDRGVMRSSHRDVTSPGVSAAVRRWLNGHDGASFFLFVHLWDPHFDFIPPPPYDTMFDPDYAGSVTGEGLFFDERINAKLPERDQQHLVALYDGEIAWTDRHVGLVVSYLREAGVLDSTIIAVTSDHGTEFFEHGNKAHRKTLFDEVIRIPLIIRFPSVLPPASRVAAQTRLIDVGPTLLELAGLAPVGDVMGRSLVPLARGELAGPDHEAISELFSFGLRLRSLRSRNWKLTDVMHERFRFYSDLIEDPGERRWLPADEDGTGRRLLQRYEQSLLALTGWRERVAAESAPSAVPPEVEEQLESLGYLEESEP